MPAGSRRRPPAGHGDDGDVARGDRGIRSSAHRQTEVGGSESGGVVDPVTDHRDHAPVVLQLADHVELPGRGDPGVHLVDADLSGDLPGSSVVVAGEQHRCHAQRLEPGDRLGAGGFDCVGDGDDAQVSAVTTDGDDGRSRGLQLVGVVLQLRGGLDAPLFLQPGRTAGDDERACDDALHPESGVGIERLRRRDGDAFGDDRASNGMLRPELHRRGRGQQLLPGDSGCGVDGCDGHGAGGDGAGLVQHDRVDRAGLLQYLRSPDEDSHLRTTAGAHKQRGGGGEPERARARDDERRDRGGERQLQRSPDQQPADERRDGEQDHDGHEDPGHPVRETLHAGFAGLRLLHQPPHPRQFGVRADTGDLHREPAADVDRRTHHTGTRTDLNRGGFAGEHARVDRRGPVDDESIGGDLLPRPHQNGIPHHQLADRDSLFHTIDELDGVFRSSSSKARSASEDDLRARASAYRPARMNTVTNAATSR